MNIENRYARSTLVAMLFVASLQTGIALADGDGLSLYEYGPWGDTTPPSAGPELTLVAAPVSVVPEIDRQAIEITNHITRAKPLLAELVMTKPVARLVSSTGFTFVNSIAPPNIAIPLPPVETVVAGCTPASPCGSIGIVTPPKALHEGGIITNTTAP